MWMDDHHTPAVSALASLNVEFYHGETVQELPFYPARKLGTQTTQAPSHSLSFPGNPTAFFSSFSQALSHRVLPQSPESPSSMAPTFLPPNPVIFRQNSFCCSTMDSFTASQNETSTVSSSIIPRFCHHSLSPIKIPLVDKLEF